MTHEHIITDSDKAFLIDTSTRSISNPSGKLTLIQYDHNSERFAFTLPRIVEGHDMAESTSIQIHYINVNSSTRESNNGVYDVRDAAVDTESEDRIKFTWLVSSNCTQHVGTLSFAVRFACSKNGITEYAWGTTAFSSINVSASILNTETVIQEHADIIAAWEERITALENGTVAGGGGGGTSLPEGGTEGQIVTINADGEYVWVDLDIPEVPTNVSAFTNDAGYLTEVPEGYAKTADIPTDEHIKSLINTALGVIENGTY